MRKKTKRVVSIFLSIVLLFAMLISLLPASFVNAANVYSNEGNPPETFEIDSKYYTRTGTNPLTCEVSELETGGVKVYIKGAYARNSIIKTYLSVGENEWADFWNYIAKKSGYSIQNIKYLDIYNVPFGSSAANMCTSLTNLEHLTLNIDNVKILTNLCKDCTKLTKVSLNINPNSSTEVIDTTGMLENCPLDCLYVKGIEIPDLKAIVSLRDYGKDEWAAKITTVFDNGEITDVNKILSTKECFEENKIKNVYVTMYSLKKINVEYFMNNIFTSNATKSLGTATLIRGIDPIRIPDGIINYKSLVDGESGVFYIQGKMPQDCHHENGHIMYENYNNGKTILNMSATEINKNDIHKLYQDAITSTEFYPITVDFYGDYSKTWIADFDNVVNFEKDDNSNDPIETQPEPSPSEDKESAENPNEDSNTDKEEDLNTDKKPVEDISSETPVTPEPIVEEKNEPSTSISPKSTNVSTGIPVSQNNTDLPTTNIKTEDKTAEKVVIPGKITSLKVKNKKGKKLKISWKKAADTKAYEIQIAKKKNMKRGLKTYTTSNNTYTVKKLKKGTYYIRVRAINGDVGGKWSKVKKVKIK